MLGIYRLVEVFHPVLLPLLETVWQVVRGGRYDHRCVFEQWVGKVQDFPTEESPRLRQHTSHHVCHRVHQTFQLSTIFPRSSKHICQQR